MEKLLFDGVELLHRLLLHLTDIFSAEAASIDHGAAEGIIP